MLMFKWRWGVRCVASSDEVRAGREGLPLVACTVNLPGPRAGVPAVSVAIAPTITRPTVLAIALALVLPLASPISAVAAIDDALPRDPWPRHESAPPGDTISAVPLSLTSALALALERHPSLALADAAVASAEAGLVEASAARLPVLSTDGSFMRFAEPMVTAPLHGFNPASPPAFDRTLVQGGISLSYTLFDGGARNSRLARAEAMTGAGEAGVAEARASLLAEVVRAYLRAQTTAEVVEASARRLVALEEERDRAAQLLERGTAARVQVLRAESALGAARAEWHAARGEHEVARGELARLTGLEAVTLVPIRFMGTSVDDVARDALLERALAASPEILRLRRLVAAAEAARGEARSLWYPSVQVVGRWAEYASGLGREQGEWQGGLQFSFPLFTGGARRAAGERAAAESRSARARLELARLAVGRALDGALAAVETEAARAEALRTAVEQAEEVVRIERLALTAGAGVQTDYLAAEAELLRVRAAWSAARAAEVVARVELARILGDLTVEWVEQNLERVQ